MKTLSFALAMALLAPAALVASSAHAQEVIDIDSGEDTKKKKKKAAVVGSDEIVREIERGWFVKANAGMATYLLRYGAQADGAGSLIRAGSVVAAAVGNDFVDEPGRSMSWDVQFYQGVHNGMPFERQAQLVNAGVMNANDHVQGDVRTFALLASYEFSGYVGASRRVGIGVRAGGGMMLVPLLMNEQYYQQDVVRDSWRGVSPSIHSSPHFPLFLGPTLEYYTKLSHFSLGIDVDGTFVVGMNDLSVNATGFMKYTF